MLKEAVAGKSTDQCFDNPHEGETKPAQTKTKDPRVELRDLGDEFVEHSCSIGPPCGSATMYARQDLNRV